MLGPSVHLRPVALYPHDFWQAVHAVRLQPRDGRYFGAAQLLLQGPALISAPGVGVQHGGMQRASGFVGQNEGFSEAGHPNPGDVRVPAAHLLHDLKDAVNYILCLNLVCGLRALHRVVTVSLAKAAAVRIKNRQLTAG